MAEKADSMHARPKAGQLRPNHPPLLSLEGGLSISSEDESKSNGCISKGAPLFCLFGAFSWLGGEKNFGLLIGLPKRLCACVALPGSSWSPR